MKIVETRTVLVLTLCFTLMSHVSALSYSSLGVKGGDWIKYYFQESFSVGTRWQKLEFLNVTGSSVTFRETVHLSDVMEFNQTETIGLASDDDFPMALFSIRVFIVPADLKIGDSIYLGSFGNRTIVGETTEAYAGANRIVVYANFSYSGSQYTFYWDKLTGVLTEGSMVVGSAFKAIWITETNMWSGEFIWWPWALVVVTIICGLIASRKNIVEALRKKGDKPSSKQENEKLIRALASPEFNSVFHLCTSRNSDRREWPPLSLA